ncbi:MAG: hypothetical protein A2V62_00280 [Nitrospirae bacterium RBG_19FT_COMBO_58_9]|nr:MAG: hypothetical protein A2V62_00280 [Nitrospirae bacterium RBG_19FT_COMBO_58_9]
MARSATPADLIVETIAHHPGCCLDDLVRVCPELTWNQIFLVVDRLSRAGHLRLALIGPGRYAVELPTDAGSRMRRSREGPVRMPALELEQQPQDAQCGRCSGLMVAETYEEFRGRRCILCGERIDPVILAQRRKSESACLRTVHAGR